MRRSKITLLHPLFFIVSLLFIFGLSSRTFAATYYIDATTGNDSNDGLSQSTPWKTVLKVNNSTFQPGDYILFKRGEIWREKLLVSSSGSSGSPITFGAYGSGNLPKITNTKIMNSSSPYGYDVYSEYINQNADFENWTSGIPTGWTHDVVGTSTVSQESTIVYHGNYSAKLSKNGSNKMVISKQPSYKAGMRYVVKFYARGLNGGEELGISARHFTGGAFYLSGEPNSDGFYNDWSGTSFIQTKKYTLTNDWQEYEFKIEQTPLRNDSQIRFEVNTTNGVIYLDYARAYASWTPHVSFPNTYGIHWLGMPSYSEILKNGNERLNMLSGGQEDILADKEFTEVSGGYIWYKDVSGNPQNTGTLLEIVNGDYTISSNGKNYLVFDNLEAYGGTWGSSQSVLAVVNSDNVTVKNCKLYFSRRYGLSAKNSTNVIFEQNEVFWGSQWGINASNNSSNVSIRNNIVHHISYNKQDDVDGHGIGVNNANNITIEGNDVYANGYAGGVADYMRSAIEIYNSSGSVIRKNKVHDNYRGGIGIGNGEGASISNNEVSYNLVYNNGLAQESGLSAIHTGIQIVSWAGVTSDIKIYNNVVYNNDLTAHTMVDPGGITLRCSVSCPDLKLKNNTVYSNNTKGHEFSLTGTGVANNFDRNNNIYYRAAGGNYIYWDNISQSPSSYFINNEINSTSTDPLFVSSSMPDFSPRFNSPTVDAGTIISGLITDYSGNPIYGTPDIGAYEYQPPFTIGSNAIDIAGNVRIYADGKFRNKITPSGTTANLTVTPYGGFGSGDYSQWMDLTVINWNKTTDYSKKWKESSDILGNDITSHTIGDLQPFKTYDIYYTKASSTKTKLITKQADNNGQITFDYDKGYSEVEFEIVETLTVSTSSQLSSMVVSGGGSANGAINPGISAPGSSSATTTATSADNFSGAATTTTSNNATSTSIAPNGQHSVLNIQFIKSLKFKSEGEEVKQLQQILNNLGFVIAKEGVGSKGNETNYFGSLTREAVKKFQCQHNIVCSGNEQTTGYGLLGLKTRAKLNELSATTPSTIDGV